MSEANNSQDNMQSPEKVEGEPEAVYVQAPVDEVQARIEKLAKKTGKSADIIQAELDKIMQNMRGDGVNNATQADKLRGALIFLESQVSNYTKSVLPADECESSSIMSQTRADKFYGLKRNPNIVHIDSKTYILPYDEEKGVYYEFDSNPETSGKRGEIVKITAKRNKDESYFWIRERICNCMTMVTSYHHSLESTHCFVEIAYTDYSDRTAIWKQKTIPAEAIATKDGLKRVVVPEGIAIIESQFQDMIEFYSLCIAHNDHQKNTDFTCGSVTETTGWKKINKTDMTSNIFVVGNYAYYLKNNNIERRCSLFNDTKNADVESKLQQKGTLEGWIDAVRPLIGHNIVRVVCYAAMASTLIKVLGSPQFTLGIVGESSIGKTLSTQVAASLIGNPNDKDGGLLDSGDVSITGLSAIVTTFNDLPCFFDETTTMKEDVKKYLGYLIANGQEPKRGTKDGKLRDKHPIRSNVILTGETDFISRVANDGAQTRVIVIRDRPIPKLDYPSILWQSRDKMLENFGHVTPLFLKQIDMLGRQQLINAYHVLREYYAKTTTDEKQQRKAQCFALMEIAGILLEKVFVNIGIEYKDPHKVTQSLWERCVIEKPDVSLAVRIAQSIDEYIESNKLNNFIVNNNKDAKISGDGLYGYIKIKNDEYNACLYPDKLNAHLRKHDYSMTPVFVTGI